MAVGDKEIFSTVPGGDIKAQTDSYGKAIVDSGTSLIIGPAEEVEKINGALGAVWMENYGIWILDCDTIDSLPPLRIKFLGMRESDNEEDQDFFTEIPADMYVQKTEANVGGKTEKICFPQIFSQQGADMWILGDTFMREYVTIFDGGRNRVGFSKAIHKNIEKVEEKGKEAAEEVHDDSDEQEEIEQKNMFRKKSILRGQKSNYKNGIYN